MKQRILLALDGSENSTRAVEYLGDMIHGCTGLHITLFHVTTMPPELAEHRGAERPEMDAQLAEELQERQRKWQEEIQETTEREIFLPAQRILEEKDIPGTLSTIETKVHTHAQPDVALAIIQEAKAGGYGTIVLGKRGRSMMKEFLLGGVTCKVIHHIQQCTIWVVE